MSKSQILIEKLEAWGFSSLIKREQIRDHLLARQPDLDAAQKDLALSLYLGDRKIGDEQSLKRWMASEGVSDVDLRLRAERLFRWQIYCESHFRSRISTLFLKRKADLDKAVYSLIWVKEEDLAQELFLRLVENESTFDQLICTLPDHPTQFPTGKLGPIPLGDLPPVLAELLRVSQPGQVWPPRQAEGGWVLLRLDELQPAVFNQGHRRALALELGDQWLSELAESS